MLRLNGQFNLNTSVVRGDKSICHRALIFAAVSSGQSVIRNLTLSRDVLSTVDCLRTLGAQIDLNGNTATVSPIVEPRDNVVLNCQNSGTTARLLAGLVAGLGVKARFVGDSSLVQRPMDRVTEPLTKLGASFRKTDGCLFESLGGKIHGGTVNAEVNSAQVKSAVLIAGLFADGNVTYVEQIPTRNHTELMLAAMGANISTDKLAATVSKSRLQSLEFDVPVDPSSMAFLIAAALMRNEKIVCKNILLNDRRTGFIRVLNRGGANIRYANERNCFGEKVGDIVVEKGCLKPLFADTSDVCDAIDELPILAAIALTVAGTHSFENVSELRHKESDRVQAILNMAKACNQQALFDGKNLTIVSDGELPKNPRFESFNDHRMALSQAVLCCIAKGGSVDVAPYDVSFPEFYDAMGLNVYKLGLIGSSIQNSRSPKLMEYLATQANVSCSYDLVALPEDVTDEELLATIKQYDGLNVTMPFKKRVAKLTNTNYCPSVNTVMRDLSAFSTDGYGITNSLFECNVELENKPMWVVGAGGAAETCAYTLVQYDCKLQVINRTQSHADELTEKYFLSKDITEPYGVLSFVPECEFEQSIVLPDSCKFVFVAAYKGQSGLKNQALVRGITYIDGLRMLYHQGAASFSLWTKTPMQDDYDGFWKFVMSDVGDMAK